MVHGKRRKDRPFIMNAKAVVYYKNTSKKDRIRTRMYYCGGYFCKNNKEKMSMYQCSKRGEWYKNAELVSKDRATDRGTVEQLMRKLKKRSGIDSGCYPHKFRRTCATMALRRGMPIEQVSKMLGHESVETTQIYLDLNEQDLEQAHKKYVV